ncbi:MAG: hypothetical protein ACOYNO_06925 [Saprospiraceae bacterium]
MQRLLVLSALLCCFACADAPAVQQKPNLTVGADSISEAPPTTDNPWIDRCCALVSDAELQKMYNIDASRDVFNTRALPGKAYCLRTWMRPNWKQIESDNEKPGAAYREFKTTLAFQVINYGSALQSTERMAATRSAQRDMYSVDVPGLGNDGLWAPSTNTLLVQKDHLQFSVMFSYADDPDRNLAEARRLAELILPRLVPQ